MNVYTVAGREYDSNVYVLLGMKGETFIVDTGTGSHYPYITDSIQLYTDLDSVTRIIITHEHFDHTGGISILTRMCPNAELYMHEKCLESLKKGIEWTSTAMGLQMPVVDHILKDGDIVKAGSSQLEVIDTPGHSPGSMCLYAKETETLLSGDTIFSHGGFGRTDLEGGDMESLVLSLKKLMKRKIKNLYPGHGPYVTDDAFHHLNLAYATALSYL